MVVYEEKHFSKIQGDIFCCCNTTSGHWAKSGRKWHCCIEVHIRNSTGLLSRWPRHVLQCRTHCYTVDVFLDSLFAFIFLVLLGLGNKTARFGLRKCHPCVNNRPLHNISHMLEKLTSPMCVFCFKSLQQNNDLTETWLVSCADGFGATLAMTMQGKHHLIRTN